MALTAAEQYMLELINRARLDPLAEANRFNLDLNSGLGTISVDGFSRPAISSSAKNVLAPNSDLEQAAHEHSVWMLDTNTFSHIGASGFSPGQRIQNSDYDTASYWDSRENLAWTGSTLGIDLERAIVKHHEGLYRSASHRYNMFTEHMREVGLAQVEGTFDHNGFRYDSSIVTQKFAVAGSKVFITGVTYADSNSNKFYSIGEGRGGYTFSVGEASDTSANTGGYAVATYARAETDVAIRKSGATLATLEIDTSDGNAKLDVFLKKNGFRELALSADTDMKSGIRDARLLGSDDLDLSGTNAVNRLMGNKGDNVLNGEGRGDFIFGRGGADVLLGGWGHDKIWGGWGADVLKGGTGNDALTGGRGADTFVFTRGKDVVRDFKNDVDTLAIKSRLVDGHTVQDALEHGRITPAGHAAFDFGNGNTLIVHNVSNLDILANDLILI